MPSLNTLLVLKLLKAAAFLIGGYLIGRFAGSFTGRIVEREVNPHIGRVSRKAVFYTILIIGVLYAIGVFTDVTTILAAAGIAGLAIGMAAQRSVSNIISGLFLLADQPFEIGDAVDINGDAGVVLDIGLFSTRLRTFDNRYLRIPNDAVANAKIINLSYYEIRRLEIPVGIAYKEDVGRAVEVLSEVVSRSKKVLVEPEPQILVTAFGESSIDMTVRVWVRRSELFAVRTELIKEIKRALDEEGIEIPFPYRTITFGEGEIERLRG